MIGVRIPVTEPYRETAPRWQITLRFIDPASSHSARRA